MPLAQPVLPEIQVPEQWPEEQWDEHTGPGLKSDDINGSVSSGIRRVLDCTKYQKQL